MKSINVEPFDNCPALDGFHCQTNSLAKIFHHYNHPLSEEMLLGLGAGMNFMYWHQKGQPPFIGARGNIKNFYQDIGKRTGVIIKEKTTSSERKAEKTLLEILSRKEPLMLYGDMSYLPWFDFPEEYHFGGHTFVVCGYDMSNTVLASDMDPQASGLKKGFYAPVTLDQLRIARNSKFKPFPPKNMYLEFDFTNYHDPTADDIYSAISQTTESMLNPPISSFGVKGIQRTAKELSKWVGKFSDEELRLNLFNVYIFIEIGGTGGGSFRYMYSRFLEEAAKITSNEEFSVAAGMIDKSGEKFTEIGLLFKDILNVDNIEGRIALAADRFREIAHMEEEVFSLLSQASLA